MSRARRRWIAALLSLVLVCLVMELVSWLALWGTENNFTWSGLYAEQDQRVRAGLAGKDRAEVIHPYLGWILNPQTAPLQEFAGKPIRVNELGFVDNGATLLKRSADKLIVGITGGSVALQMSAIGSGALERVIRRHPAFAQKKVHVVRLALSGFKQPQQLMSLNYVLALGGEFDVMVNIDGYNEVALVPVENDPAGVFAAYPRVWHTLTMDIVDPRRYADSFRLLQARGERQELAQSIVHSPFRFSATRNLIWKVQDRFLEGRLATLGQSTMSAKAAQGRGFVASGPPQLYEGTEAMYRYLATLWKNSSLQMDHICRGNGIAYLHVLQPNQYVPHSKPMDAAEQQRAVQPTQGYGRAAAKGYPLLIDAGKELLSRRVRFIDETQLFASITEPIYSDAFCHFNERGNVLLAEAVGNEILKALGARSTE